jgi:putative DNA primase/helicase
VKPLDTVLEALELAEGPNGRGEFVCFCPGHEDRHTPNLLVGEAPDETVKLWCSAGCSQDQVLCGLEERGVPRSALFPQRNGGKRRRKIVATYDYHDPDGRLLFQVVRFEPKDFRQRRPNGNGGWIWNLKGIEPGLYRLPEVLEAVQSGRTVYVGEGEKDADRLASLGLTSTTSPMGAKKWRKSHSEALRGAHVVILPDADAPGREHAEKVALSLQSTAASVTVLELPDLAEGGDVSDWLDAGGSPEKLEQLTREVPNFCSSAPREGVADERVFPFKTAREVASETPAETEWIAPPWAARGAITELDGKIKAGGKTTLFTHLVGAVLDGKPFLGSPTKKTKVVYLTEQGTPSFRKALERAELTDREDLYILKWGDVAGLRWHKVGRAAKKKAKGRSGNASGGHTRTVRGHPGRQGKQRR